jgi:HK97 gp10 family phage protein
VASELLGVTKLSNKLKRLVDAAEPRQIRSAVSYALTPVVKAAKAAAPVGSVDHKTYKGNVAGAGYLSRNIKKSARVSRDKQVVIGSVGPSREAFYGTQFVEVGTRKLNKAPWLTPVFESNQAVMLDRFGDKLKERIKKAAK